MDKQQETEVRGAENVYVRSLRPIPKHNILVKILHTRRAANEPALRLSELYNEAIDLGTEALEKIYLSHIG